MDRNTTPTTWKDHPLAVGAVTCGGTVALAVLLFKEIVLPTYTASLQNEITNLKQQVLQQTSALQKKDEESKSWKGEAADLANKLEKTNGELFKAYQVNLFLPTTPYPNGLAQVRVGDPIENLSKTFPPASIEKREARYWTVKGQHPVFTSVTFYFDDKAANKPVTHISFSSISLEVSKTFLQEKLIETFGPPTSNPRDDYFAWKTPAKLTIFKSGDRSYLLVPEGRSPAVWPSQ